jgi:2-octaprenyl-6-methoxyphenol hydroxylase
MKVCLIGDSLTSLVLAKILANKKINVFLYYNKKSFSYSKNRTIGISKTNLDYLNTEVHKLKKSIFWDINEIEVYSSKYEDNRILEFNKPKSVLFSIFKNNDVYKLIDNSLKKNKFFKKFLIKDAKFYKTILLNRDYDLIINCENNNPISKKLFYKKIIKDYKSLAYTTIINHQKFSNNKAVQVFTEKGPIAFLPISNNKTSIVFSKINQEGDVNDLEIKKLIFKNNKDYQIKKFKKFEKFQLKFSATRSYYYGNVMEFGDSLHRIHPLAGQGFNMTLRDLKKLSKIIQNKIDLGLNLDHSIYEEFQKETMHYNSIFLFGIDFIYEFFKFDSNYKNNYSNKIFKFINKNKFFNRIVSKYADEGLSL